MEKEDEQLADPLANYWGLSLFPSASLPPSKPCNPDQDLRAIHSHLKSMTLQSPAKLMEQVKSILDKNPELFNSENSTSEERNDVVASEEEEEVPRQRRPALGLKRPRFSMKATKKASVESLLPTLDLDNLKDPVEFFLAHERLENAKREIQKQLGGASFESDQDDVSTRPRRCRPGLLGNNQRLIKYNHQYPKETSDNNVCVQSSQGTFESDLDTVDENTDKGGAYLASSENEEMDSSAADENQLNEILDGLLSCNAEDLEGDGAITLLQERLQIKPIVLEKFSVPDFPDNQVIDLKSLRGNTTKPRKALSDIDNLLKGMNNKTPLRQDVRCPLPQLASSTPPRSPFASLSSLQKHILRSKRSVDPFSTQEIDHLSIGNRSPIHTINQELDHVGLGKPSNEQDTHMIKDVIAAGGSVMGERVMDDTVDRSNIEANVSCPSEDEAENRQTFTASVSADAMEETDGSLVPVNGQERVKLRSKKESKNKRPPRKSLAAAGTTWNSGVRRSTRIRTRPLEYWKGERMVYGRVHESLATVIGIKCISPGSDGKPTMKVKSYVSDQYKELLDVASLY